MFFSALLHTWGQELNYHPHIHCIVSGAGLTSANELRHCTRKFLVRIEPLAKKFRGKFMDYLKQYYDDKRLTIPESNKKLRNSYYWSDYCNRLYQINWNSEIRETFNGNGNAISYLGRYANRIAITNTRIISVDSDSVTFKAKDYKTGTSKKHYHFLC